MAERENSPSAGPALADRAAVLVLAVAFGYVVLRAARLSVTHDEALTYLFHVRGTLRQILFHSNWINSNNHLLNTLLIKVMVWMFGLSEFVLRLPALAGCAMYFAATFSVLRLFSSGVRRVLLTALFVSNPLLIDYFSQARGYGLGVGFSTLALTILLARHLGRKDASAMRYNTATIVLLACAVLSNLGFANLFIAVMLAMCVLEGRAGVKHVALVVVRPAALTGVVLALVYNPIVIARIKSNLTTWGGTTGFWSDTVGSIVGYSLFGRTYFGAATTAVASALVAVLLAAGAAAVLHARWSERESDPLAVMMAAMLGILLAIAASFTFQFVVLGTRYALDRGGIYLVPPFFILIALTWEYAARRAVRTPWAAASVVYASTAVLFVLHGVVVANTTHTLICQFDANDKDALRIIEERGRANGGRPARLGVTWVFEPAANFYRVKNGMTWLVPIDREGADGVYDYYYVTREERSIVETRHLRVLADFPTSGAVLAVPQ